MQTKNFKLWEQVERLLILLGFHSFVNGIKPFLFIKTQNGSCTELQYYCYGVLSIFLGNWRAQVDMRPLLQK